MKNKGFTLIELIVTITILAAISVVVGVSLSGMLSRQNDKDLDNYYETIEKAACAYAEVTGIKSNSDVAISVLVANGYIKKALTNPSTKETVTETNEGKIKVTINWNNGERTCKDPRNK